MATMYPQRLPSTANSPAERKLYNLLKDNLSNDYTIIYNLPLTRDRDEGGIEDSEIDFLVLHPQKGILNLEIKGGGVSCDSRRNTWYSIDQSGNKHKIKDPFMQAINCMYTLMDQLKGETSTPLLRRACRNCTFGRGVVFPDIDWKVEKFSTALP